MPDAPPTRAQLDELLAFLPLLERPGAFVERQGGEAGPGEARQLGYAVYAEPLRRFLHLVCGAPWAVSGYDTPRTHELVGRPELLAGATLVEALAVLTLGCRGERFCDGLLGSMLERGVVRSALARVWELAGAGR